MLWRMFREEPLPRYGGYARAQVTREVFAAAKGRLKVVGRAGVGVDNVDLASATDTPSLPQTPRCCLCVPLLCHCARMLIPTHPCQGCRFSGAPQCAAQAACLGSRGA